MLKLAFLFIVQMHCGHLQSTKALRMGALFVNNVPTFIKLMFWLRDIYKQVSENIPIVMGGRKKTV